MKHSDLERQLEGMERELMRQLLQAHLELRQPGKASELVRDAAGNHLRRSARTRSTARTNPPSLSVWTAVPLGTSALLAR